MVILGVLLGVLLGSNEYASKVIGLVSFLLHCNASTLVHEFLKRDKMWGQFALASPLHILGDSSPCPA